MIEVFKTRMDGLLRLRPRVFTDERGHFMEPFNSATFAQATGITDQFLQDNESRSTAGVLRGLHVQTAPHAQAKLVRVVKGAVLDVCVDLRPGSPPGEHFSTAWTSCGPTWRMVGRRTTPRYKRPRITPRQRNAPSGTSGPGHPLGRREAIDR
jgi:hypothetical protein